MTPEKVLEVIEVYRWLGFIQGVLWASKAYTLAELKDHNRPPGRTYHIEPILT